MRTIRRKLSPSFNGLFAFTQRIATSKPHPDETQASAGGLRTRPDRHTDLVHRLALGASLLALAVGLVDFSLLVGALPIPIPGLRAGGQPAAKDTATYAFEFDNNGWLARGAGASAVSNNIHVFAGQGALEFQVKDLSAERQAFVYTTMPSAAKPRTKVVAHAYAPAGAPTILATIYFLDATYAWHSGPYFGLNASSWTALACQIPANIQTPIRELGVMTLGTTGAVPYTGPLYLDSVDLQSP